MMKKSFKKKKQIYIFLIILFLTTLINYFYQVNYTEKLYTVKLNLKNEIIFNFTDKESFFSNKDDYSKNKIVEEIINNYKNNIEKIIREKVNYEMNYDENLIQMTNKCQKFRFETEKNYLLLSCVTSKPDEFIETAQLSIFNILNGIHSSQENLILQNLLLNMGITKSDELNLNILKKNVKYNKNIQKNIFLLSSILLFVFIVFMTNFIKIKKIFSSLFAFFRS